jgi:hypothetical protein
MKSAVDTTANTTATSSAVPCTPTRIEDVVDAVDVTAVDVNTADVHDDDAATTSGAGIEGRYRVEWTIDELEEWTLGLADDFTIRENVGVWDLVFSNGAFDIQRVGDTLSCGGSYSTRGGRVVMTSSSDPLVWTCGAGSLGEVIVDASWTTSTGTLSFDEFVISETPDATWWFSMFGNDDWSIVR